MARKRLAALCFAAAILITSGIESAGSAEPKIRLTAPTAGSVLNGTVPLRATVAAGVPAASVQFRAGSRVLGSDPSAPYEIAWDTTTVTDGSYTLRAFAFNASGQKLAASARVKVTVRNAGTPPPGDPTLTVTPVLTGLDIPWDLGFLPGGEMVFTERPGRLSALVGGVKRLLVAPTDVQAVGGEGGLLGLAIDPQFATNRRVYTCYNVSDTEVRVVVWTIDAAITTATRVGNLVTGLPANSTGRHSGCRPRVGPDGFLWVGTGDAATGTNPQDVNSLGGKVLRVDRFTGTAAPGNPNGRLWYTLGHRNVQGLAFRPGTNTPYSVEHGPDRDDELNRLVAGGNYGWNPVPGYNESVPMTFAGGVPAVWSSGIPTIATSGATFLTGAQWEGWNGRLAVANLKGSHLRVFALDSAGTAVVDQDSVLTTFGRLRTPVQGPDGSLYVTTSNGGGTDQILRVTPS